MSRIKVDRITDKAGTGAPTLVNGMNVTGKSTMGDIVGAAVTFNSLTGGLTGDVAGNVTGNVTGNVSGTAGNLSGTPDITVNDIDNRHINSSGIITASSYRGDGSQLTGIESAPEYAGIASGSITGGKGVCVADDGKLMGVTGDLESRGVSTFATDVSNDFAIVYHEAADRYVLFYRDNNNGDYGQTRVGTRSGTTITWGAKQQFGTNSLNPSQIHAIYDSTNEKVVVAYRDNTQSSSASVQVCDVSGTTITIGTAVNHASDANSMEYSSFCFCPNTGNYALVFNDGGTNKGWCRIGKYSGTNSSTWPNSKVQFQGAQARGTGCFYDTTANKLIVMAHNAAVSNNLYIVCGTISGDAVTFTSGVAYDTNNADGSRLTGAHDPSTGKNILCYGGASYYGQCRTATLSGTTFTFGTPSTFNAYNTQNNVIAYGASPNKFMISYWDQPSGDVYSVVASLSGTTITYDTPYLFQTNDAGNTCTAGIIYNSDSKQFVSIFRSLTQPAYFVEAIRVSNATSANYVGIANASYTNGQTASIALPGAVNTAVSGVAVGLKYYVLADGSLNATADSANIFAGQGIGANKLLIR